MGFLRRSLGLSLSCLTLFFALTITGQTEQSCILLLDDNLALIEQQRKVTFNKGINQINFVGVDEGIILESVNAQIRGCRLLEKKFIPPATLVWKIESEVNGEADFFISYLTRGIKWNLNYQMEIDEEEKFLNLSAWLNLENKGGVSWWDTNLTLVGKLLFKEKQEEERKNPIAINYQSNISVLREKERILFSLSKPVNLGKNEEKSFLLFSLFHLPLEKLYLFDGEKYGEVVREELVFHNPFEKNSNFFLPAGTIYIYKNSPRGRKFYLGTEKLSQISPGEEIHIYLGTVQGINVQRIQTFYRETQLSAVEKQVYKKEVAREYGYKIILRNQRSTPVKVKVIEHLYDLWQILESKPPVDEKKTDRIIYRIVIPPGTQEIVEYKAKII